MTKQEMVFLKYATVISLAFIFFPKSILIIQFVLLFVIVKFLYKNLKQIPTERDFKKIKYFSKRLYKYLFNNTKNSIPIDYKANTFNVPVDVIKKNIPFTYGDHPRSRHCEFLVERYLSTLDKNKYTVINNVMIPSDGGNTTNTQIDHVVVSRYGIFCIETKSHRGWIYCKDGEDSWLQILPKSCNTFYSPSRQNYAHKCALHGLLGDNKLIVPIIVLTSADAIIKKGNFNVGNIGYMLREIDKYKKCIYTQYEYERIVKLINNSNKNDEKTAYDHCVEVANLMSPLSV